MVGNFSFLCFVLLLCWSQVFGDESDEDQIFKIPQNYDKTDPPLTYPGDEILIIEIRFQILSITEINVAQMSFTADFLTWFFWKDFRVNFTNKPILKRRFDNRVLVGKLSEKLWLPIVYFFNCIGCELLTINPKMYKMFYYNDTQKFQIVSRNLMKFTCNFDLTAYPMDKQICQITLNNGYESKKGVEFSLLFAEGNERMASNTSLADFEVQLIRPGHCVAEGGSYACVQIDILLRRLYGHYVMTIYVPTFLVVVLSWVSFWLDIDATPARTALGLTSLLTLATQFSQAQDDLPAVSYVKAMDVWMFACIFVVFASLIEFALANYSHRRSKSKMEDSKRMTTIIQVRPFLVKKVKVKPTESTKERSRITPKVDLAARIIFPTSFFLFVLSYWLFYSKLY